VNSFTSNKNYRVQLWEEGDQLPAAWNAILPGDHFLHSSRLALYETMRLTDISFLYAMVWQGEVPVAAAYFQVLTVREQHLNAAALKPWQRRAWKAFTTIASPRVLVAGHLFRHDICSFYAVADLGHFDAFNAYRAAIGKALQRSCAAAVLLKDVSETLIPYFRHYAPEYLLLRNDISMEMEIPAAWETIADYEKSLKHKYAQRFRKVRQSRPVLDICELSVADTIAQKDILYKLYQQVSSRQQVRLGILSEDFLPELKRNNPNLHIWLAYHEGQPVAFFSAWIHDSVFDMFYIGFDYARNDELQLYFNILFFAVEQAVALRKQKLILGRTALEAKARLGCKPAYLSTYLYIKNPVLRNVITRLQQNINSMEGEWENRHPFKK